MAFNDKVDSMYLQQLRAVRRVGLAADLAGAAWNIFTISGGDILVTALYGKVTTIIAGAATPRIQLTPTGGALTPLTAAALSIDADAVNTMYYTDGAVASVLAPSAIIGVGVIPWGVTACFQILVPGVISITNAGAVATGVIDWFIVYIPMTPASLVTSA